MAKKIVLVDGSNLLGEMIIRAIAKESDLQLEYHFQSFESLTKQMEADWMGEVRYFLILGTDEQASQTARRLLARFPGAKTFNLAVNGSRVTLRYISKEIVQKLTLPELLDVLRAA